MEDTRKALYCSACVDVSCKVLFLRSLFLTVPYGVVYEVLRICVSLIHNYLCTDVGDGVSHNFLTFLSRGYSSSTLSRQLSAFAMTKTQSC